MAAALLIAAAIADVNAEAARLAGAYRSDSHWAYFRNDQDCSASLFPRGGDIDLLIVSALDADRGTAIGFTRPLGTDTPDNGERPIDIRLFRAQSVLDEGWENVGFTILPFDSGRQLYVSQPLDAPAAKDFEAMTSVEFLTNGKVLARFDVRGAAAALTEIDRCVKGLPVRAKTEPGIAE